MDVTCIIVNCAYCYFFKVPKLNGLYNIVNIESVPDITGTQSFQYLCCLSLTNILQSIRLSWMF